MDFWILVGQTSISPFQTSFPVPFFDQISKTFRGPLCHGNMSAERSISSPSGSGQIYLVKHCSTFCCQKTGTLVHLRSFAWVKKVFHVWSPVDDVSLARLCCWYTIYSPTLVLIRNLIHSENTSPARRFFRCGFNFGTPRQSARRHLDVFPEQWNILPTI